MKSRHPSARRDDVSDRQRTAAQTAPQSCTSWLTQSLCQWQRLSFIRRGWEAPDPTSQESIGLSKACVCTRHAVPTGEAHRLPKSVAYVSALPPEVKDEVPRKSGLLRCAVALRRALERRRAGRRMRERGSALTGN